MPSFAYVARNREGKKQKGTMTAESKQALASALQRRGLTLDEAKESGGSGGGSGKSNVRVKSMELLVFTRQLATIVNAGLPLLQGLDILSEQSEDPRFRKVMREIGQSIESGETFSDTLRRYPRIFSDLYVSMVRAGEASGDLDGVLAQLADYLESMAELVRKVRSAMSYPVMALSLILLIVAGLLYQVVPSFEEIFKSFGNQALPRPTAILIMISHVIQSWKMGVVIAGIAALVFATRLYGRTASGRYNLDIIKLRIPIFGKLLRKIAISRFTRTLSTLTRSGVPILGALEIAERTSGNEVFAKAVRESANAVRNGETLGEPLARSGQFPAIVTRMISVGEKTGALEQMLGKISDFYDSEVKATVEGLTAIIEPVLIMLMGIIVGGIVIALFMPILGLSKLISGSN